jgi:hypothetical protein
MSLYSYFYEQNGLPEVIFFVCNFFSSSLPKTFLVYLVANFFKIINAMRVSDILGYFQQRWKEKMIKKYEKEREKLEHYDKKISRSITRMRRKSQEQSSNNTNKVGHQLREKYTSVNPETVKRSASMPRRASLVS